MGSLSLNDLYGMIREQIRHEDNLVNQRLNWLLLSQAFLFTLFTSILTADRSQNSRYIDTRVEVWIPCFIAATGIILALLSFLGIVAAFSSLKELRTTWKERLNCREAPETGTPQGFPQITWVGDGWEKSVHTASGTPFLLVVIWGFLILVVRPPLMPIWSILLVGFVLTVLLGILLYMFFSMRRTY